MNDFREMMEKLNRIDEEGAFDDIPQRPQRQDSLDAQLRDLQAVANKLGMYDAADFLNNVLNPQSKETNALLKKQAW